MTLDGSLVTVHLADGTTPTTGAYIIGAEVLGVVNGTLVTLFLTSTIQTYVKTFNTRSGDVTPTAGDYDGSMVDYDNTSSGLTATDLQSATDELATKASDLANNAFVDVISGSTNANGNLVTSLTTSDAFISSAYANSMVCLPFVTSNTWVIKIVDTSTLTPIASTPVNVGVLYKKY